MNYTSQITFIYYEDFSYGEKFIKSVLGLKLVMDQGFAQVYEVNNKAFLGIVKKEDRSMIKEDTLISLTTKTLHQDYKMIQEKEVYQLTEIKDFPQIPLQSFFFEDKEGHHFEIQQFQNIIDQDRF